MYKTFLNDIFSDDNEDIKVRLNTTPRTDNYNRIAAANTPDYAAGLGALSNHFDNKNNALQTQLDFAKNNYNQSNRKVLLDAILAHEQNMFNLRSGHEKDLLGIKNTHQLGIMDREHTNKKDLMTHETDALIRKLEAEGKIKEAEDARRYANSEKLAEIDTKAAVMQAETEKSRLEAEIARREREEKRAYDKSLIDQGIDPRTLQPLNKTNTVPHGGISLKKPTESVNVQNNAINTTTTNTQNSANNTNTINNDSGMNGYVDAALIKHDLEKQQKEEANKNFNTQNTLKNQYGDHYTAGMNINRWELGDTKNKMPKPIEEKYNVDPLQHNAQRKGSRFTPDNSWSFADPKNRLNVSNQDLLNIENAHKFMDQNNAGFLPNGWEDVDAEVKTGLLNNDINFKEYEPIVGPEGEFYLFNYDTGNIYGFDSVNGLELVSMPEQQSFFDYIGEDIGNFLSKRSLDNLANITPTKYLAEAVTTGALNSKGAYEIAQDISNEMDRKGGDYIRNNPWLSKPVDGLLNLFNIKR